MQYAPLDLNTESSPTPSHLHMPSVKNRQGRPSLDPFSKTKVFCFGYPQCLLISLSSNVCYAFVGHGFSGSHRRTPQAYTTFFYWFSLMISCLNHIPSFSPEGVSIPTCFTHLHTYFSCHATVSLNLDVVLFY